MNELPETVTAKQLAAILGIGDERVRQLAKEGTLTKVGHAAFVLAESVQAFIAYREKARKNQHDGGADYEAHRARLTAAKADMAEMQAAILKGTAHEAKAVEAVWTDHLHACRAKFLAMPKKLAPRIHGIEKLTTIEIEIETTVVEALNELAAYDPNLVTDRYVSAHREELDAAAEMDGVPVERHDPKTKPRSKRRTRTVGHVEG